MTAMALGSYLNISQFELNDRADRAYEMYKNCHVCPHQCHVDRTLDERGYCQMGDQLNITASVQHFGEEPIFTGSHGVGNLFITSCNMQCVYCQNYQASQIRIGKEYTYYQVAQMMLDLQKKGVHFIGWVSPSHVVPGLLKSLAIARKMGLSIPIIYNTNAFDSLDSLALLDGIIDVYLPDLKYSNEKIALDFSKVKNYVDSSRKAVSLMYKQVGALEIKNNQIDKMGLYIRHLVLPNQLEYSWEVLCFIALELSPKIPISIMGQYHPIYKSEHYDMLNRFITQAEYDKVIKMANELGIETIFTQEVNNKKHNLPDFKNQERPFIFD